MKISSLISSVVMIFFMSPGLQAQNDDAEGCKDHPMFDRMPGYKIIKCASKEFDAFNFPVESSTSDGSKKQTVEGKCYFYSYAVKDDAQKASALQIFRNFENGLRQIKGYVVARVVEPGNSYSFITGKIEKENMTTWVLIQASGNDYQLTIIEKQRMVQVIMANEMWNALDKNDSVTLDILFNNDTTTIIPASLPIIDQINELLINHPSLKLSIQCHTDNSKNPTDNKILTAMRAKVVLDAITAKGIDKTRLKSLGWGSDKPVADNKTEEGREKNRRIVIVKK
jgi:OmpA-OmpF porin, OOP family